MKTDQLIAALAADAPAEPGLGASLARWLLPALALTALALLGIWGLRPGLAAALMQPAVAAKVALPLVLAGTALVLALRSSRPEARPSLLPLAVLGALALALLAAGLLTTPQARWPQAWLGNTALACLISIPALAVLPLAAGLLALRRGASTSPARTGLLAGLLAGAAATALYALHCPEDSPLFYVCWYGLGIVISGAAGRLLGPRLLRW
ncbi:DUF1109 family protein [Frigidibacter albus]|uniref:DUF1109 family protein n=1 Tax=Frigidibacter albus TaxID=1465486 RepID=A0A6L8VLF7_9RHOB|nr:NrsF family protein [Frigidibacter albus]MZQ89990.1 DUF1109 family protein [Frigidibacter albus]NBE31898.1 DUF1109 family protein [Frigidibacter albus]GGH57954.1 hypothetical protein GCM10011341_27870 [Frigidibacter albus]